ncbi:MFS transporter [Conexibacter stalactiti]|uniref:MFS transporter n=1 Tax=Conexibacter stalactiti TaxID=1940611 RepID=A0ABU4HQ64_9ACTN|nr:MFS transporter [Conexibacter stalactiti]MDW5595453.1 MFS transporter [Conexibacter stalactiti]MEC5036095.1 MFS transporter [Conexibacter stalactiti]
MPVHLPEGGTPAGRGVLAATCVSTLVVNANTSAVSILLPAISADVGTSTTTLQWAVTGYSLVGAAVIVTGGVLGDIAGRRKVFVAALLLFVASCVLIALAGSGAGVIAGRMIQGAAGSTLLACGMSLLSVGASGAAQMRAVSIWGAASAVGAAAGPLVGGALVDTTGWQGLFWIDAAIAAACIPLTLATVPESRDPERPHTIDLAGTLLVATTLVPFVLALTRGPDWGWGSALTLGCFAVSIAAGAGFVAVERRVRAPLLDLALLRNKVLVGATLAILIGAGTINGLMYVVSLYFQDPAGLGMSPLDAGLATLPATVGLIVVSPFVSDLATRIGSRQTIGLGFAITTVGFAALVFVTGSWAYGMFVLPLIAIALGMGLSNGCASSASTATVPQNQVGSASGVSNMARYVGAALVTAAAATIYGSAAASADGAARTDALVDGVARSALLMTIASALGIALALLYGRHRPARARTVDRAAAAAVAVHTLPTRQASDMTPKGSHGRWHHGARNRARQR